MIAVTFIYTRCPLPDFCPLMDRQFASTQELINADDVSPRTSAAAVGQLQSVVGRAACGDAREKGRSRFRTWTFLTGEEADIESFAARFGVPSCAKARIQET